MSCFSEPSLASSADQLQAIAIAARNFLRLPFAGDSVPGAFVEAVVAKMRGGDVLRTYDFVDVVSRDLGVGWQVKSTMAATPVTWKRAKIPDSPTLIEASHADSDGLQALGDAIIKFCNDHALESMETYGLSAIGYSRVIVSSSELVYFERELVTGARPKLFEQTDFRWTWSTQKETKKKEQLSALHGFHKPSGERWFAWHGLGENQLHFTGEKAWWPADGSDHRVNCARAKTKLEWEDLFDWLGEREAVEAAAEVTGTDSDNRPSE